jgi:hypothetical protein
MGVFAQQKHGLLQRYININTSFLKEIFPGALLTASTALCYVWESEAKAMHHIKVYQAILGTSLKVEVLEEKSGLKC